jgi:CheY-like chemotaxis protein
VVLAVGWPGWWTILATIFANPASSANPGSFANHASFAKSASNGPGRPHHRKSGRFDEHRGDIGAKKEQKLSRTAAAVFVITQEDIERSGATNIPDLLRMVPGLQVAQINGDNWAITARGFDGQYSNKLLVRPELATATIMMLTSAGHRGDAARCLELGVSAYLLKPTRQSELREAVARVLGARESDGAIPLITRFSLHDACDPSAYLRVLLAEDNAVNQRLAVRLLEKRGHRVAVAENGREALIALEKEKFDLVFMDVQMPEMDGFEATVAIREREKSSGLHQPIIALTAHAMKGDREQCLAAGMDGYLTKPIRPQELEEILEGYLARRSPPAKTVEIA